MKSTSKTHQKFLNLIKRVPRGMVATYGQIARLSGLPGHARQVVWTLHSSSVKHKLPWHKIINTQGRIGIKDATVASRQKILLEKEGVEFSPSGIVDLKIFQWKRK